MQKHVLRLLLLSTLALGSAVNANEKSCVGTSRILEIEAFGGPRYGTYQYPATLDLKPREIVLTFDDGPEPSTTPKVLDALDAHCIKATFFAVGQWAERYPELTREIVARGHTLGTHTWSHPRNLRRLSLANAKIEIDKGFSAVTEVAEGHVAPFFRFPGFNDSKALNKYVAERHYANISCDISTDDWKDIDAKTIIERTLKRLEQKKGGILLFHDPRPATAEAIPVLLDELQARGYTFVHLVPKASGVVARAPEPPAPSGSRSSTLTP